MSASSGRRRSCRSGSSPTRRSRWCCAPCRAASSTSRSSRCIWRPGEARIGGDFYEAVDTPYGVRLLIGDVRGKGLSAVGAAAAVVSCFREAAYDEPDLGGVVRRLETSSTRYNAAFPPRSLPERFATALSPRSRTGAATSDILNCGHPPPLLLNAAGRSVSWSPPPPRRRSTSRS